jgi:hypothetical protein
MIQSVGIPTNNVILAKPGLMRSHITNSWCAWSGRPKHQRKFDRVYKYFLGGIFARPVGHWVRDQNRQRIPAYWNLLKMTGRPDADSDNEVRGNRVSKAVEAVCNVPVTGRRYLQA